MSQDEKLNKNEDEISVLTMVDDQGKEYEFEFLGEIKYYGKDYILISSLDELDDQDEPMSPEIIEVCSSPDSEENYYETVEDPELFGRIMELFMQENPDDFIYI